MERGEKGERRDCKNECLQKKERERGKVRAIVSLLAHPLISYLVKNVLLSSIRAPLSFESNSLDSFASFLIDSNMTVITVWRD